jgi:hypothetical protein
VTVRYHREVMCIFTGAVAVRGTRIFGRVHRGLHDATEQFLVYQMAFGATQDTAMVLPLPIAPGHGDAALRFIDLSTYPKFFEALDLLFPQFLSFGIEDKPQSIGRGMIAVQRVGDFEASYVPSVADFARLDKRFRLSSTIWEKLPAYRDYGFAVFKLFQPKRGFLERIGVKKVEPVGQRDVHPMGFAFRTRTPDRVFFPTVHVHDGEVHANADFDHELYCQLPTEEAPSWERSLEMLDRWALDAAKGVLVPGYVHRRSMHGSHANEDVHAPIRDTTQG